MGAGPRLLGPCRTVRHRRGQVILASHWSILLNTRLLLVSFWRGIWTLMTKDVGLGPAQLLVIMVMALADPRHEGRQVPPLHPPRHRRGQTRGHLGQRQLLQVVVCPRRPVH